MSKKIGIIVSVAIVVLILGLGIFLQRMDKAGLGGDANFVSRNGLHWHSDLSILVKGEHIVIPSEIGIGAQHNPMHTPEDPGVIHMEFPGLVQKENLTLGSFFKSWNKDMRSFGTNMKMTVNGVENTEFENYQMKDKDKIVLTFE